MILYGSSFSPYVRKVMVFASEKGLDLPLQNIALGADDPEFLRASPFRKMPGLTDGDFAVSDSSAIVTYLDAKYPDRALIPADAEGRARAIWFDEFADTIVGPVVRKCFFNRIVAPYFLRQDGNEAEAVEGETKDLPLLFDYLEGVVPDAGGFLVGGTLSLADIAVASPFVNFEHARCAVDKAKWPRSFAWLDSMHARPSYAPIIEGERKLVARMRGN